MINEEWLSYAEKVIPSNAPEVQRAESRRAFYAGAQAVFSGLVKELSDSEGVDEADLALMYYVKDELSQFAQDVIDRKA